MKKFIIFALATALCFALCACGGEQEVVTSVVETTTEAVDTAAETTPITEATTTEVATTEVVTTEVTTTEATTVAVTKPAIVSLSPDKFCEMFSGDWSNNKNEFVHFGFIDGKPSTYMAIWDSDFGTGIGEITRVEITAENSYKISVYFPEVLGGEVHDYQPAYSLEWNIVDIGDSKIEFNKEICRYGRHTTY